MISIRGLSKQFKLYSRPADRLWEWVGGAPRHRAFWALRNIELEIPKGRTVGIIGPNGAGKSTLLKIVTGVLAPTSGSIEAGGRIAALLELGTGFHAEFTGRQNIWINGQLLGLSPAEIREREARIIEFSELGPFIDQPLRTYSSGMAVRLGFSVAASVEPDILIIDEALSVGDAHFSQKCIRRIRAFRESGTTILFVSHDPGAIVALCDEAVLLDAGEIAARGRPEPILEEYTALLARRGEKNVEMTVKFVESARRRGGGGMGGGKGIGAGAGESGGGLDDDGAGAPPSHSGTFQAFISSARWLNSAGNPTQVLISGEAYTLELTAFFFAPIQDPTVGFLIRDRLGMDIFGTNTRRMNLALGDFEPGQRLVLNAKIPINLGVGDYSLTTAIHRDETHVEECYDWANRHYLFHVAADRRNDFLGAARLFPEWNTGRGAAPREEFFAILGELFRVLPKDLPMDEAEAGAPRLYPNPFLFGFYRAEKDGDGRSFRWAGGDCGFAARLDGRTIAIRLAAWGRDGQPADAFESEPSLVRFTLEAGGVSLGERMLEPGREAVLTWDLPAPGPGSPGDSGAIGLFRLRTAPEFVEKTEVSSGRTPPRRLGAAFLAVSIQ